MDETHQSNLHTGDIHADRGGTVNVAGGDIHITSGQPALGAEALQKLALSYLEAAARSWACIRSGGVEFPLAEVYCMLQALETPPPRPLQPREEMAPLPGRLEHAGLQSEAVRPKPVALGEALQEARHLALLGEPGAGKSTTLQFIGLCFAS